MIIQYLRRMAAFLCIILPLGFTSISAHALDVNTATAEELLELKGIGPKRAEAIVRYRNTHGPFKTREELLDVPGIGSKVLAANADAIELPSIGQPQGE